MADNEMELIGTALANFDRVAAGLALLEKNFKGVLYEVDTTLGMAHAKAARSQIREPRYEVERLRKDAKAPLLSLGKRLDAEATRITNALLTLENPIHEQIKGEEDRIEQEKIARANAEAARVANIQRLIDGIRNWPVNAAGKHSSLVNQQVHDAVLYTIDPAVFQEKTDEAKTVLESSRAALSGILTERRGHEAEQERIKAERIELEKLRAEQAERDRVARETQAAETARQNEILRKERAENERIARERQADLDAQAEAQRKTKAAEDARIASERAELERQQEAMRKANEPKPKAKKAIQNPGRDAIATVLAEHYSVDAKVARQWLREIDWEQEAA